MGEFQNKAVALMTKRLGQAAQEPSARRDAYAAAAIRLFYALGGTHQDLMKMSRMHPTPTIDAAIGEVMMELAALGTAHDLDIMQAGYNTLDHAERQKG